VVVIGCLNDMRFTPKAEVQNWAVLGRMVRTFDVIFVSRTRTESKNNQQRIFDVLNEGQRICIFPEGTTSDGRTLKPFKASLFALAEQWDGDAPLPIQPIALEYSSVDGVAMGEENWDVVAWHGDDTLLRHLWRLSRVRRINVTAHCLPPVCLRRGESRKTLCAEVEASVRTALKK
jgi:lyso-ornithine lipid O-acyltransferase